MLGAEVDMAAVDEDRQYAAMLGWSPGDFGATDFDQTLVDAIRGAQGELGVTADGVCGPATYAAWLDRRIGQLRDGRPGSSDWLRDAGAIALYQAKRTWLTKVIDPPDASAQYAASRATIDAMIRTTDGLDWSWSQPYVKDGDYEWCGASASYMWRAAGIAQQWRYTYFSSTFRLDLWARYLPFEKTPNPKPDTGPYRQWVELDERSGPRDVMFGPGDWPRMGDILLVGGVSTGFGKHVTLVESYDATTGTFTTMEGNAHGVWPDGTRVQGVIRNRRPVGLPVGAPPTTYHARRVIRPALTDLE
jgi:hypothetical protein